MSEDLFAAFGDSVQKAVPETASRALNIPLSPRFTTKPQPELGLTAAAIAEDDNDVGDDGDDDFGDFEDGSVEVEKPIEPETENRPRPVESPAVRQPVKVANTPKPLPFTPKPSTPSKPDDGIGRHPFAGHMDLLFSLGDDEYDAGEDELNDLANNPQAAMEYSKRIIAAQLEEQARQPARLTPEVQASSRSTPAVASAESQSTSSRLPHEQHVKIERFSAKDPDVLFDIEDMNGGESEQDDDDDFGDFEGESEMSTSKVPPTAEHATVIDKHMPALDLLGLDEPVVKAPDQVAPRPPAIGLPEDDTWDDFEESNHVQINATSPSIPPPLLPETPFQRSTIALAASNKAPAAADMLPPTNVPPPGILLSLFPPLFASAQAALFDPVAKLDVSSRHMLLAHPATHQFLRGYLSLAVVLGRILAGRKHRWKRDPHLKQGMRIGPAAAGGGGGMKLAGLDKTEAVKEDREVLDAVRLWKAQVGRLRAAVASAGGSATAAGGARLPPVPDIAEQMPVKALKAAEGGITAPHACALCGLRREERVGKVDGEVDDSFGEWWVQAMSMHLACRNFWEEYKGKLKSR